MAFPAGRNVGHVQFNDDLSWTHGRHTFKAGIATAMTNTPTPASPQSAFLGSTAWTIWRISPTAS